MPGTTLGGVQSSYSTWILYTRDIPCFAGVSWLQYDDKFRMRGATNLVFLWDQIHPQLRHQGTQIWVITHTVSIWYRRHGDLPIPTPTWDSQFNHSCFDGNLMPREPVPIRAASTNLSVPYEVVLTLSWHVPEASHRSSQGENA